MEKEIYEKLVTGDTTVFEQVFKETYKDAYLLAFSFMKKQEDAEDVLQDSYIKMFNNISKLQDTDKFKSWFNQIIVNNCKNALKKSNRYALNFSDINDEDTDTDFEDSLVNEDETLNPEDVIDKTEITNIMAGIINSLPEEQSLCLQMFYYQDMKINDIASALDISENTVKSRLRIAKDKVSAKVEEFEKKNNIKLHSISLIPLFFKISVENSDFPQLDFSKAVLPSLVAGTAGASFAGTSAVSSAVTSAHATSSVATTIASTTAKTVAAAATKKIIAIAVATAVTVTGVGVGAKQVAKKVYQKSNAESTSVTQTVEATNSVEDKEAVEKEIEKYSVDDYKTNVMPSAAVKYKDYIYYCNYSIPIGKDISKEPEVVENKSICRKNSGGEIEIVVDEAYAQSLLLYGNKLFYASVKDLSLYMLELDLQNSKPIKINDYELVQTYGNGYDRKHLLDYKLLNGKIYYICTDKDVVYGYNIETYQGDVLANRYVCEYDISKNRNTIIESRKSDNLFISRNKIFEISKQYWEDEYVYNAFENDEYLIVIDKNSDRDKYKCTIINKLTKKEQVLDTGTDEQRYNYSNVCIIDNLFYAFVDEYDGKYIGDWCYKNVEIKL